MSPVQICFAVMVVVVLIAEIGSGRHRGIWTKSSMFLVAVCFLGALATKPIASFVIGKIYATTLPTLKGSLSATPFLVGYLIIVLVSEFCFYWAHRLAHEGAKPGARLSPLWKLHRTHHSGKYMSVLLNWQVNPFWFFVLPVTWVFALAVYLGLTIPVVAASLTLVAWNTLTHSNFAWDQKLYRLPVAGRIFRGVAHILILPSLHHSHHGYGKNGGNFRNYGTMLALYDWMFGTLFIPSGRPWKYGIPGETPPIAEEILYPFTLIGRIGKAPAAE